MASDINDVTINFSEGEQQLVKELDKVILTKGAWATLMFKYQQLDRKTEEFGQDLFTIRRYQKKGGEYIQRSKFNISNKDQAKKIIDVLKNWTAEEQTQDERPG
ncbi:MAG: hypothetical protein ISR96_10820 [Nitrospira sp.]|nr:hypothetical protein [Nitrospira sp.]